MHWGNLQVYGIQIEYLFKGKKSRMWKFHELASFKDINRLAFKLETIIILYKSLNKLHFYANYMLATKIVNVNQEESLKNKLMIENVALGELHQQGISGVTIIEEW